MDDAESALERPSAMGRSTGNSSDMVIRIPVVVHVLYSSSLQNISDEQVRSQIASLNRDFRRDNSDTVNTPARFRGIAADVAIEFVLASSDPEGYQTTGIVRKFTTVGEWSNDDRIKFTSAGGDDAWDPKSYLNIWVGQMRRIIGYASAPGGPTDRDGLVITPSVFGTIGVREPYNLGRTVVHEVGHWLGLRHIWGDSYCGNDGVDDTPPQGNFTAGCPNGFRSSCNNGQAGDMYMNYMDFTSDACMNLFTNGQKLRMRNSFAPGGPKESFLKSTGLSKPWNTGVRTAVVPVATSVKPLSVYPNPATSFITVNTGGEAEWIGTELRLTSVTGGLLQRTVIRSRLQSIDVSALLPGVYLLRGQAGDRRLSFTFIKN
ncbi:MAG: type sorting protein [Flaviaesturariibacter sp.]|nr:type sorting protein [Flaviaesturariibacter sp.]